MAPNGENPSVIDSALKPLEAIISQLDSLAEKGINYMLCIVGAALLIILAINGAAGNDSLGTGEFIALVAASVVLAVTGAGFRALATHMSLRDASKASESALDIAKKAIDDAAETRRAAGTLGQ